MISGAPASSTYVPYDDIVEYYDEWVAHMPQVTVANREFYARQYVNTDGVTVELGVGNGRILIAAASMAKSVIGIDNSSRMRMLCSRRVVEAGLSDRVRLTHGEFRTFTLSERARLVAIPYDSLGHLGSAANVRQCFAHVYRQLEPGGIFIFDMLTPSRATSERDRGPYSFGRRIDSATGRETRLWVTSDYDQARGYRRSYVWSSEREPDDSIGSRRNATCIENATFAPEQLVRLLIEVGFQIGEVLGDFQGSPLRETSDYQVFLARR